MSEGWRDWNREETARWLVRPKPEDDKYSRGVVGMATGSARYPGAAVLGVEAAARSGAGMVRYLGDEEAARLVLARRPEIVTAEGRVQSWVFGSGMDAAERSDELSARMADWLRQELPTVLDAGALDLTDESVGPTVLTPHAGELSKLLASRGIEVDRGAIQQDPQRWARRAADETGATVLLKGHTTHVVAPGVEGLRVQAGSPWLATAGSGDVLAGVLGALLASRSAQVVDDRSVAMMLAATAATVHGAAGDLASGGGPIVAMDIAEAVPRVIAEFLG